MLCEPQQVPERVALRPRPREVSLPKGPPRVRVRKIAASVADLSPRQAQIVTLIAEGLFYKEISAKLGISIRTVNYHVAEAFRTTGASNREDLVRFLFHFHSTSPDVDPDVDQFIRVVGT